MLALTAVNIATQQKVTCGHSMQNLGEIRELSDMWGTTYPRTSTLPHDSPLESLQDLALTTPSEARRCLLM